MPSRPWYPKNPSDYLADTAMLSLEAHGFYNLMLDYLWINDGYLPADEKKLGKLLRLDTRVVRRNLKGECSGFFKEDNGKLYNSRLLRELTKAIEKSKKAKESVGKRWGYERINERNTNQETKKPREEKNKQKRKTQLPESFVLTTERETRFTKIAPELNAAEEFALFTSHHKSKGSVMVDWDQAWLTWCRQAKKFNKGKSNGKSERRLSAPERVAAATARRAAEEGY